MSVTAWLLEYWCLWTVGPARTRALTHSVPVIELKNQPSRRRLWLTLHQVLVVDGGQVGEVLLEVRAELSVGVDLDQLLLAARLLAVKVGHVLLRLGADLGAAAAHVVRAQHVLHHGTEGGCRFD